MVVRPLTLNLWFTLLVAALLFSGCKGELGEKNNPIRIFVVPSQGADRSEAAAKKLAAHLEAATDLKFTVSVPQNYIDLVVAVGNEEADLLFMNDMSYLLANDKYGASAAFAVERADGDDSYRGMIFTRTDSGINSLEDLEGKTIGIVDVYSASGYILPAMLLREKGVSPGKLERAGEHDLVVKEVYSKGVDAGFSYTHDDDTMGQDDARARMKDVMPDVFEVTKVLAVTTAVPSEPVVFGAHVPSAVREKVSEALADYASSEEGRTVLMELNEITGLHPVTDRDYDPVRKALLGLGEEIDTKVEGGGLLELRQKVRAAPIPPLGD